MARQRLLWLIPIVAVALTVPVVSVPLGAYANEFGWKNAQTSKGGVEVRAGERSGGRAGGGVRADRGGGAVRGEPVGDPRGTPTWCGAGVCGWAPEAPVEGEPGVVGVTLEDVASFVPVVPKGSMEPGPGIAVRRLPANFLSHATEQVVSAPLLGRPAEVRFTPVQFAWETGDGDRIASDTPGSTWSQLRAKELTDTATSHRYRERGFYDVRPMVTYEASYRFDGSGWVPVGELDVAGDVMRVRVVTVETRLTRGTCLEYPNDPGCR